MLARSFMTAALLATALAPVAQAFVITPVYENPADWNATEKALISHAIADWQTVTADTAPDQAMAVTFRRVNAGLGTYLGQWQFGGQIPTAFPYSPGLIHHVYINAAYTDLMSFSADAPPSDKYDFLTLVRHELGHALGFADRLYLEGGQDRWMSRISDNTFDAGGLNVPMRADGTHVNLPDDLMHYQLVKGVRKDISATDIAMLSLAYGYTPIPEPASLTLLAAGALLLVRRRH